MTVRVIGPMDRAYPGESVINTTSRSCNWSRGLSPFLLGPVPLWGGHVAQNVENAWQFSKVYREHVGPDGYPTAAWYAWASSGWRSPRAFRYPMGKNVAPDYSYWNGACLDYIPARLTIYLPLYGRAVVDSEAWTLLEQEYHMKGRVTLWDFDGYDSTFHKGDEVLPVFESDRKCGHAFVLAALLLRAWG